MSDNSRPIIFPMKRIFSHLVVEYEYRTVVVDFNTRETVRCRIPKDWSDNAASTLMSKYAVRSGVEDGMGGVNGREVDAYRIFHRLVAGWRHAAIQHGYWTADDESLDVFCCELVAMLEQQIFAPNSPQWFNTGVSVCYGIKGEADGHYHAIYDDSSKSCTVTECEDLLTHPQVSACFIQTINDDLVGPDGIMDLWLKEARLFKSGSGSGANYSKLRGKAEPLSRGGSSSGLLSFLRVGDRSAGAIKSGGTTRRAARMVIVDDDHPDVEEFIRWKTQEDAKIRILHSAGIGDPSSFEDEATETVSGQNANNSIAATAEFLRAVENGQQWRLLRRTDGGVAKTLPAQNLWNQIVEAAWACADPGLFFIDTVNEWHTCKSDGKIRASNPCVEYVFLDDTACNLASLNLCSFLSEPEAGKIPDFAWDEYQHAIRLYTIVLDISVSMAGYPTQEIARRSILYRTIGAGYAALGELLVYLELGYGTEAGREFAAKLTSMLTAVAYRTSIELARKLGAFPRFEDNRSHVLQILEKHRAADRWFPELWLEVCRDAQRYGVRNGQVTVIAPTGTIGIVMDCDTTGAEPVFSDTTFKYLAGGGTMQLSRKCFSDVLLRHGYQPSDFTKQAFSVEQGTVREYVWIEPPDNLREILICADELTPYQHVDMIAAIQPFLSGSVSKTCNMRRESTREDVSGMYMYAWKNGLKAISIYRDGCKPASALRSRKPSPDLVCFSTREEAEFQLAQDRLAPTPQDVRQMFRGERLEPAERLMGRKIKINLSGHTFYLMCFEHNDGSLAEVFVVVPKTGSAMSGWVNAWAKTFSLALQHGTPLQVLVAAMSGESFDPSGYVDGRPTTSPIDAFAREIARYYLPDNQSPPSIQPSIREPNDRQRRSNQSVGLTCISCGSFDMQRSGTCFVCRKCSSTTGCS